MPDLSIRQGARLAGYGLLFMFIAGIFASGPQSVSSLESLISDPAKLRMNIVGDHMMVVFDTVVALGLYILLKPVSRSFSLLGAWFRLMYVAIYGASSIFLMYALQQIVDQDTMVRIQSSQEHSQIIAYLKGHEFGFQFGTIFFGFHLIIVGYLIIISNYIPKYIGIFLMVVALGYLANSFLGILHPHYEKFKTSFQYVVFLPAMLAEIILCLWLIFKANKITEKLSTSYHEIPDFD